MTTSFIYSHIRLYRSAMNLLYVGKYRQRFDDVVNVIGTDTTSVCELCFGDTLIADWCRANGIRWTGVDLNPHFCTNARKHGHRVIQGDLFSVDLPSADVFVMVGSLHHFHSRLSQVFDLVWGRTTRFMLSEPVRNLSSDPGVLGWWARRSANPGDGHQPFRYREHTLLDALRAQQARSGLTFEIVSVRRDMLIVLDRDARSPWCKSRVAPSPTLPRRTWREEGEYRQSSTDEQRGSVGCSAGRMQRDVATGC